MATINEVLERTSRDRPDAFSDRTKAGWLLSLEGRLYREVVLRHCPAGRCCCRGCGGPERPEYPRRFPEDGDVPLLAEESYDRLYDLYLMAQADFYSGDDAGYARSAGAFNAALGEFRRAYHREHMPAPMGRCPLAGSGGGDSRGEDSGGEEESV